MSTLPETVTLERPAMGWSRNTGEVGVLPGTYEVVDDVSSELHSPALLLAVGDLDLVVNHGDIWPF